jgi:hypothetical protein
MAKRFTDTSKWKKEFIKGLSAKHKLLWFYILDDCDHAGVWEVDFEVASLRIGENLVPSEALEALEEQIQIIGKNRWWIRGFISFQYGNLTPKNKMYEPVMSILQKFGIDPNMPHTIPHKSPIDGVKVMVIVKEEEKVKEKVKEKDTGDIFEYSLQEQIEEKLLELDSRYLDEQKIKWPHLDFNFEYQTFCEKVRGSPEFYKDHSEGGIRLAFQKQLRDKKINGTSGNRKQQHTSKLAQSVAETYRNVFTGGGNGEGGKPPA